MATGVTHRYTAVLAGVTNAGESAPEAVAPHATDRRTLIGFAQMAGNMLNSVRIRRTDAATATNYSVHIYVDSAGTKQVYSVYGIDYDAALKWDFSVDDLNTRAVAEDARLYVTAVVNSGATPIDVLVDIYVSQDIGGN